MVNVLSSIRFFAYRSVCTGSCTDGAGTKKSCEAGRNVDELAAYFPSLSLKTQGLLDKPSCPMLIVNGKDDLQTPIEDLYLLLEHGDPKTTRVFPGGHMGQTPETLPTIVRWLRRELEA